MLVVPLSRLAVLRRRSQRVRLAILLCIHR
jgi:hypothetical protein